MFIYKVEYFCGDGSEEASTFSCHLVAARKYKEILNDKLLNRERYGTLSMWSEELDGESKEFIKNGLHRILHFNEFDYDVLFPELEPAVLESTLTKPAPRNSEYDHLPGRFMSSGGESQFVLLGYKDGYKIATIKAIREHVPAMDLKKAKEFVECASSTDPSVIDGLHTDVVNALARNLANSAFYRADYPEGVFHSEGMN